MSGKNILIIGLTAILATGCVWDDQDNTLPTLPSRTILVYLGADDSSLSATLVSEVETLRKGWTYTGNRCLIYIDPADDVPRLLSLRGGCRINPTPYIDTLAVYSEENSASAEIFARVLSDVKRLHPADSYGLIFTSHASGWLPQGTLANPTRSLGSDTHTGTTEPRAEMELADFAAAIPDNQFDFVIFEACLMSGVEVAHALRNKTDYMVASSAELLSPGFIPIYASSLRYLCDTSQNVEAVLVKFTTAYYNYIDAQSDAYRSATLSVVKTDGIDNLAALSKEVFAGTATNDISTLQHFDRPGSYGDSPARPRYFDFMDSMKQLSSAALYAALEDAMDKTVVWKAATPTFLSGYNGFTIARHSGLTVYIEQPEFVKLNTAYRETSWYRATHQNSE